MPDGATHDAIVTDGATDATTLDPRLVIWFPFSPGQPFRDEVSGDLATCTACPQAAQRPTGGDAMVFTGSECLTVPTRPSAQVEAFTVALWFHPDAAAFGGLFGLGYRETVDSDNSWSYWFNGDMLQFYTFHATGGNGYTFASAPLGQWRHYAVTRTSAGELALYLDGQRQQTQSLDPPVYLDGTIHIGCDIDFGAPVDYAKGALADIRLYNDALDVTEVAALAANL